MQSILLVCIVFLCLAASIHAQSLLASYFRPQLPTPDPTCQIQSYDPYLFQCSLDKTSYICRYPSFPVYGNTSSSLPTECMVANDLYIDADGCVASIVYSSIRYCPLTNGIGLGSPSVSPSSLSLSLCDWPFTGTSCTTPCYQSSDAQTCRSTPMSCENVVGWYIGNQLCQPLDEDSTVAVPQNSSYKTFTGISAFQQLQSLVIADTVWRCYFSQSAIFDRISAVSTASTTTINVLNIGAFCDIMANGSSILSPSYYRAYGLVYYQQQDPNMADFNFILGSTNNYMRCLDPATYAVIQRQSPSTPILSVSCTPCQATCNPFTEVCSSSGTGCTCVDNAFFNSTIGHCQFYLCPDSTSYGFDCSQTCDVNVPLNSVCDSGPTGSGNTSCPNPLVLNAIGTQCTKQHCAYNATDGSTCNNHGLCSTGGAFAVCFCDIGYEGTYCQYNNDTALDVCDCGTTIQSAVSYSPGSTLSDKSVVIDAPRIQLLQLYTTLSNGSVLPTNPVPLRPIGSVAAATYLCWLDVTCTGVMTFRSPNPYNIPVFGGTSLLFVLFLMNSPGSTMTLATAYNSYSYIGLSRFAGYNCPSSNLNAVYYYQTYRGQVQDFLQSLFPPLVQLTYSTSDAAALHWRYIGANLRYSPNSACLLTPLLYTTASQCATPTCPVVGTPCNSHGYCITATTTTYGNITTTGVCQCNSFASSDISVQGLGNVPAWSGIACQYSSLLCLAPGATSLCSGFTTACQPRAIWTPNIGILSLNNTDYVPQCNCNNLPVTGQYCQTSRCGSDGLQNSNGCNLVGACLLNTTSGAYSCVCPAGTTGVHCEIQVPQCANYGTYPALQCSNQGQCLLNTSNVYNCSCYANFSGSVCQNSACAPSIMIPGHGNCVNGVLSGCFPVYTGSRCQNDMCSTYGGIVTNGGASCDCSSSHVITTGVDTWDLDSAFNTTGDDVPINYNNVTTWQNLLNGAIVATCWPQCPYSQGQLCGVAGATCLQVQGIGNTRAANCQCPNAYILNSTTGLCTAYCSNGGTVDGNWTPQRPTPCLCPNSGFYSGNPTFPLCNTLICTPGQGIYNNITQSCQCFAPFSGTNCNNLPASCPVVVPWLIDQAVGDELNTNPIEPVSPYRCSCVSPRTYSNPALPFDCLGNQCAPNGIFFASTNSCICIGQWKTGPNDPLPCQSTYCLNGGYPNMSNPSVCSCEYPFTNGPLGVCENTVCINETTLYYDLQDGCVCNDSWEGAFCEQSVTTGMYYGEVFTTSSNASGVLSNGAIAGIVIGGVVGLIALFAAIQVYYQSRAYDSASYHAMNQLTSSFTKTKTSNKKYT